MLNAYSMRMTSRGLGSDKAEILEEVLLIKFSLKHSLSIFAITHFQKTKYGCCPARIFKSTDMVVVLLAFSKAQIWLLSYWNFQKLKYGCCPAGIFKSSNMVVVLLAFLKKSRHGCRPVGTFKIKSPDMVDVLLEN